MSLTSHTLRYIAWKQSQRCLLRFTEALLFLLVLRYNLWSETLRAKLLCCAASCWRFPFAIDQFIATWFTPDSRVQKVTMRRLIDALGWVLEYALWVESWWQAFPLLNRGRHCNSAMSTFRQASNWLLLHAISVTMEDLIVKRWPFINNSCLFLYFP